MNSKLYDRTEVQLVASCSYDKESKIVKLYLFNN